MAAPPDPRTTTVALADHQTAVLDSGGSGPPVVVLHSLGLDLELGAGLAPLLGNTRLIAYDLRSHGTSTAPASSFSLEQCALDLIRLLDALDLERVDVCGFSLGGAIAQLAALLAPHRIRSLVLVCTMDRAKAARYLERAEAAERAGSTTVQLEPTLERWFTACALAADPPFVGYARECVLRASVEQWSCWWRRFAALDIRDRIATIACPATLIAGELDRSTLPAEMREMATRIPGAAFHVIPKAPHMAVLEQPCRVAELIAAHLERHGRGGEREIANRRS